MQSVLMQPDPSRVVTRRQGDRLYDSLKAVPEDIIDTLLNKWTYERHAELIDPKEVDTRRRGKRLSELN